MAQLSFNCVSISASTSLGLGESRSKVEVKDLCSPNCEKADPLDKMN